MTVSEITDLYRRGELSPLDVVQDALKAVLKYNPVCNAFVHLDEKGALHQAKMAEKRWRAGTPKGRLDGVPVTIKDWFHVKGWPTRFGSRLTAGLPEPDDSPSVRFLRDAGAIFIGKTTLPEYGHKGVTDSPLSGITRNPWNPGKTSGGSSGGAAVAAASGMGLIHLGSDAGGSIRIPASFCGVVGFKPSPGVISAWPPGYFATMSSAGPLTRSVADAALAMDVLAQQEPREWQRVPSPPVGFVAALSKPWPGKPRIAVARTINGIGMEPAVGKVFQTAIAALRTVANVEEIALETEDVIDCFNKHWMAVASRVVRDYSTKDRKKMDARFLHWASRGDGLALPDYLDAQQSRMLIAAYFSDLLVTFDFIVTPTTAMTAFDCGSNMPEDADGQPWDDWTPFTYPANLARLPALSIPCGLTPSGMPVGLQIMGGYLRDADVLAMGQRLEKELAFKDWLVAQA